jgi:4-amino-4-deoxy-L-arabinose transferase-like glycosyltransferase
MHQATELNSITRDPQNFWRDIALLILVAGSVFFVNLGSARLWDRDEPRNAGCAVEMWQRGDWVTPMFNDELRGQKPVLTYWLMMSAISVFGVNEFAVRFWSALLGVGTVLLTYLWVRHLLFPTIARWTGLILSTTLMFTVAARAATPDAPLIFFTTLALASYVLLTFKPSMAANWDDVFAQGRAGRLRRPGFWFPSAPGAILVYAAMALGVLAKGPVAVVLPTIMIGLFILIESSVHPFYASRLQKRSTASGFVWLFRRAVSFAHPGRFFRAVWQMQPWWLVLTVAVISVPWFVWVGLRTEGEFLQLFFFREHLERATTAMEGHRGGWWFYPLAILIGVFPWSILVVPALLVWRGLVRSNASVARPADSNLARDRADSSPSVGWANAWTLASVWVGLQVVVFSIASTKLPSYVTPCYPAVALLLAMVPTQLSQTTWSLRPIWMRAGFVTWVASGIAVSAALVYVFVNIMQWSVGWLPAIGGVLIVGGIVAWYLFERQRLPQVSQVMFATSWLFAFLAFGYATQYVSQFRSTDELWQIARAHQRDSGILAGYRDLESTWVYYAGQPIWELTPISQTNENSVGESSPVAHAENRAANQTPNDPFARQHDWEVKPRATVEQLLRFRPGSIIVTPEKHLEELLSQLPAGYGPLAKRLDFLTRHHLVLVGPTEVDSEKILEPSRTATTSDTPRER